MNKKIKCGKCKDQFASQLSLWVHVQSRHEHQSYNCLQCEFEAMHKSTLTEHNTTCHGKNKHSCHICEWKGRTEERLKNHNKSRHTDDSLKIYKCLHCEYKTRHSSKLPKHNSVNHSRYIPKYFCDICEWEGISNKKLQNHIKLKHAENTLRVELKQKIGKTIDNEKQRQCPICLITLKNTLLQRHLDRHSQIKVHKCDQCDKKFVTFYELNTHKLIHNTNKKNHHNTHK